MTAWETAVCQRAVEAFGKEHQLIICMEEMAELLQQPLLQQERHPHRHD